MPRQVNLDYGTDTREKGDSVDVPSIRRSPPSR